MSYKGFGNTKGISISKNILTIDSFKGVDLTNAPSNVSANRSPEAPNMIRDVPGKVRKRLGYHKTGTYDGAINGIYRLNNIVLIHAGTKLYRDGTVIYSDMNNSRGQSWQLNGEAYILDGKKMLVFKKEDEEYVLKAAEDIATAPLIIANKKPDGSGGSIINPFNLLSKAWKEQFLGDGQSKEYQLSLEGLNATDVIVKEMGSDGQWTEKTQGTDFTVDRTNGIVTFVTAPPTTPASGVSNIEIQAAKDREDNNSDIINKCDVSIIYGQSGLMDRLFVTGNSQFPNRDYWSDSADHTYFGDTWFSEIGQDSNRIVGYSIINNYLAAHKNEGEDGRNIIMRYSGVDDIDEQNNAVFNIVNSLQGEGAIGKRNFVYLNEPLFATKRGIYAVTAADITGEKYSQNRSFYINKALEDEDLENAYAIAYKDFYIIACEKRVYILDTLQKEYSRYSPYSTFQYECYYWEIPDISIMWEENETLCFGTKNGGIYQFYTDTESVDNYNDDGNAIAARWDIPDINGKNFFKNKTFRYMSVRIAPAITSGFDAYSLSRGIWTKMFATGARSNYLDFSYVDFEKINFSSDTTPRTLGSKIKVKKADRSRFSIRNENLNEPLGIYDVAFEYTQGGNFKG